MSFKQQSEELPTIALLFDVSRKLREFGTTYYEHKPNTELLIPVEWVNRIAPFRNSFYLTVNVLFLIYKVNSMKYCKTHSSPTKPALAEIRLHNN